MCVEDGSCKNTLYSRNVFKEEVEESWKSRSPTRRWEGSEFEPNLFTKHIICESIIHSVLLSPLNDELSLSTTSSESSPSCRLTIPSDPTTRRLQSPHRRTIPDVPRKTKYGTLHI